MLPVPPRLKFHGNIHAAKQFKRFALSQLEILKKQMSFQGLKQSVRRVSPFEGVLVECVSKFGLHVVNIFVAPVHGEVSLGGQEICTIPITHKKDLERVSALIHCVWRRWDPIESKYKPSCFDMTAEDETYTKFTFTSGYALISPYIIGDFSQVRYTQMNDDVLVIASALHYTENAGEDPTMVIQVLGEANCPNFIERYSIRDSHVVPYISLSTTLDTICTTVVSNTDSTGFSYRKFDIVGDQFVIGEHGAAVAPAGYRCISGTPHRDGTAGSFAKETHHFTDEATDDWGGGDPAYATHRETTDIYDDYYSLEPYTLQVSTGSLVVCADLLTGLVVMVDEVGDWDYRSYKSSGTLTTGYWSESYCSASWSWSTALDDYSGGTNNLVDHGDRYSWILCDLSEERGHLAIHHLFTLESSIDNSYDPVSGWSYVYSWNKSYEHHVLTQGFQTNTMNFVASVKNGVEYTMDPLSGGDAGAGNMTPMGSGPFNSPCGAAPDSLVTPEYFNNIITLHHPCKEPVVDIFSPGAITCAHDQELGLSFYEYRYKSSAELGVSYQSYICVRNKNTETDITNQVYAAMIVEIDKDIDAGIIADMTHEEKITHCMETFMYIYFEEVSNTVYDV